MLYCPHCLRLSTMVNKILTRHSTSTVLNCSILLTTMNNMGSTTLFNPVELQAHDFLPCNKLRSNEYSWKICSLFCLLLLFQYLSFPTAHEKPFPSLNMFCSWYLSVSLESCDGAKIHLATKVEKCFFFADAATPPPPRLFFCAYSTFYGYKKPS